MAFGFEAPPDDVAAVKAALVAERERSLKTAAELAVANAKAAEDKALIAAQKLRIAKLERQIHVQRSERSAQLIEQLSLEFEELAASATEDELAAEKVVAKTTSVRAFTRRATERDTFLSICRANALCWPRRRSANAAAALDSVSSAKT